MHLAAKSNEYADAAGDLLDATPKAVWAAIAISALTTGGDRISEARELIATEWDRLHSNGIVPQRVPGRFRGLVRDDLSVGCDAHDACLGGPCRNPYSRPAAPSSQAPCEMASLGCVLPRGHAENHQKDVKPGRPA